MRLTERPLLGRPEDLAAENREIRRLREQRQAVLDLHAPDDPARPYPSCQECTHGCGVGDVDWPCATVKALGAAA